MKTEQALVKLDAAAAAKKLSSGAVDNIRQWLTQPRYAPYASAVIEHIAADNWQKLDDVFWTVIPFGTGGRRGRMYAIGTNAINDRTIGESAQGLAAYVRAQAGAATRLLVRHRLRHATPLAALRGIVCRHHGGRRFPGLLAGRLSQHARTVVSRTTQAVFLRHHGHGEPQSAERQRGQDLLVHGRAGAPATRPGHHRPCHARG